MLKSRCVLAAALLAAAAPVFAQTPAAPASQGATKPQPTQGTMPICGGIYQIGPPAKLPPANSGPVIYQVAACFEKQGGYSVVDPQTYLYYMQVAPEVSRPAEDKWFAYTDKTEQTIIGDFKRLMATNFLDDLSAETYDYVFSNGVVGKIIVYNMEERQRVKIVDYIGSKKVEMSQIDEELK